MKQTTKVNCLLVFGFVLFVIGIVLVAIIKPIFDNLLENTLVIEDGTSTYDSWVETPVPVSLKVYLFNVTNPNDVRFNGATPIIKEVGPYTYSEQWTKDEVEFYDDEGTVKYQERTFYEYDEANSVGPDTDRVVILNPLMPILASKLYNNKIFTEIVWPEIEEQSDLFEEHSIAEIFFTGWDLPLFDFTFLARFPGLEWTEGLEGTLAEMLTYLNISYPEILDYNKLAIFYASNATLGPEIVVNTGEEDIDTYLFIVKYDNMTELDYWDDVYCNMINGSDGSQFPPFMEKNDVPRLFMSDLCRSLYFEYEKETQVHDLIDTYRYITPVEMFQDPNTYEPNKCFCLKVYEEDEKCLGTSMLNLATCSAGIPLIMSTPHFYQASEEDINSVIGFNPNKDDHETFLDIDPLSGVVLRAEKRIQLNLPLRRYPNMPTFRSVPELTFPLFWFSEGAELSRSDAEDMNALYTVPFIIAYTLGSLLMAIGLGMMLGGLYKRKKLRKTRLT